MRYRRGMPGFDLHTHSTFSDGTLEPEQVVELATSRGLTGIALTDHDNTGGVERARAAATGSGLTVLGGCELSAEHDDNPVHVLAYGFDPAEPAFAAKRAWIFEGRVARTRSKSTGAPRARSRSTIRRARPTRPSAIQARLAAKAGSSGSKA